MSELESESVAPHSVWRAPSLALLACLTASGMMWAQGEVDAYAPALLGGALWVLWRLPTGLLTVILSEFLAWIGAGLLAERALPHLVFTGEGWRHVALSFTLALCAALLIISSLVLWGERRREKAEESKKKSAQAKPERS